MQHNKKARDGIRQERELFTLANTFSFLQSSKTFYHLSLQLFIDILLTY